MSNMSRLLSAAKLCSKCRLSMNLSAAPVVGEVIDASEASQSTLNCFTCFGMLEESALSSTGKLIALEVEKQGYHGIKDFVLCVSLPLCFTVRQVALEMCLAENGCKDLMSKTTSVRESYRAALADSVAGRLQVPHNSHSDFSVTATVSHENDRADLSPLIPLMTGHTTRKRKHGKNGTVSPESLVTRESLTTALKKINIENYRQYLPSPETAANVAPTKCEVSIKHASLFLAGRYNKYDRKLSQTPWLIDGERLSETSVQELICEPVTTVIRCSDVKFLSSGREDVDVRMLGDGRPFAVELVNPRELDVTQDMVAAMENTINSSTDKVAVRNLCLIPRDHLTLLKAGEEEKVKHYSARIWSPDVISDEKIRYVNALKELVIHQSTPIRVLHRRTAAVRDRMIHELSLQRIDDVHYHLELKTQAGTYIKEFVHGDLGRTVPSLSSLVDADVDILELDVMAVELDWPPRKL